MLDIQTIIYFLLLGSFVGVISGFFGIGGREIIVPILTTIFMAHGIAEQKLFIGYLSTISSKATFQLKLHLNL